MKTFFKRGLFTGICLLSLSLHANQTPWSYDHPEYVPGRYGEALKCDWVRSRAYLKAPGYLNPEEGTIQLWVSPVVDLQSLGEYAVIVSAAAALPHHDPQQMSITLLPPYSPASYQNRGIKFTLNGKNNVQSSDRILNWKANEWHALAMVWGKQGFFTYIDGELIGEASKRPAFFDEVPELISFGSGMMTRELSSRCVIDEIEISDCARSADYIKRFAQARESSEPDEHVLALNHCEANSPDGYWKITDAFRTAVKPGMQASSGYLTHNHMFSTQEKVRLPVTLFNPGDRKETFALKVTVKDFYQEQKAEIITNVTLMAEEIRDVDVDAGSIETPGFYEYLLECKVQDKIIYSKTRSFVLTKYFPKENLNPDQNMFGNHIMNMRRADVFSRIGIGWDRGWHTSSFQWPEVEPEENMYDWRAADYYVKAAEQNGYKIVGVLGDSPEWAGIPPENKAAWTGEGKYKVEKIEKYKPRDLKEFYTYVYDTVSRYKDSVKHWEIWNEPDWNLPGQSGFAFGGTNKDYLDVLKTAYDAAKAADPSCVILSGGLVPLEHLTKYLTENGGADYFDVIGMHRYRPWGDFNKYVDNFRKASGAPKPAWQTERVTENPYFAVLEIKDSILSGVEKYFFFGARNFFSSEAWLPKSKYFSVALCVEKLHNRSYSGEITFKGLSGIVQGLLFDKGLDTQLALLIAPSDSAGNIKVRVRAKPESNITFTHYMGKTTAGTDTGSGAVSSVDGIIYVEGSFDPDQMEIFSDQKIELLANASFEKYEGDLVLEGLDKMKIPQWSIDAKKYDPEGRVVLSDQAHGGELSMAVSSGGKGRVHAAQKVQAASPGTYVLSAFMKVGKNSGSLKPNLAFYFPENKGAYPQSVAVNLKEDEWTRVVLEYEITKPQPVVSICGIQSGAGTVFIDDVFFGKKEEMELLADDFPDFYLIDLSDSFNESFIDSIAGDGRGGFADLGDCPFKTLTTGVKKISEKPFFVKNESGENSSLILRGWKRPDLPEQSGPVNISKKMSEISFLYTALFSKSKLGDREGVFIIKLESGKCYEHPLVYGKNIFDWYVPDVPRDIPVDFMVNDAKNIGRALFMSTWVNPDPSDPVESVQFQSEGKSILVLLAMTGKK
jgi:hypothetical protein